MAKKAVKKSTKKAAAKTDAEQVGHLAHMRQAEMGIAPAVDRPLKVVFLGAGSAFLEKLAGDVMSIPGADEGEFALVDIDTERLALAEPLVKLIAKTLGKKGWSVTATPERKGVLSGADYIINCIEVSGTGCVRFDNDIPLKYGVDQCIGDTIGPGGLFKALRTVPVFLEVLEDVQRMCPDAWVLNYTNPMSIMCLAAARASKAKMVGLCHSVQGASHAMARWAEVPYHEMKWTCAGVNHLAWFTEYSHKGEDLYPRLKEKARTDAAFAENDLVRFDLMEHFGYYCTESSGHDSEYLPYYRKRKDIMAKYCRAEYRGGSSFYADNWPKWRVRCDQRRKDVVAGKEPLKLSRSWEYASFIIESMETNAPGTIYGTVPNTRLIENLPTDGVVEVACTVDRRGISPNYYGKLPPQCAGLSASNMHMFDLAADACIARDRTLAEQALMLDPLTAAVCCPAEIRQMTRELFEAEKDFLPGF